MFTSQKPSPPRPYTCHNLSCGSLHPLGVELTVGDSSGPRRAFPLHTHTHTGHPAVRALRNPKANRRVGLSECLNRAGMVGESSVFNWIWPPSLTCWRKHFSVIINIHWWGGGGGVRGCTHSGIRCCNRTRGFYFTVCPTLSLIRNSAYTPSC